MVVVNVPKLHARKLHALVGILAATAAFPAGCSDEFEGCEASRTCPPKGGEAGSGSGGESGGGDDSGGSSSGGRGGNSGTSGTSGTDDGGEGGTGATGGSGGSGDDAEPPTIVSITPGDGDVDVERDVTVTIEFSEAIDEDSVTETSVVITGPDGDVAGTLGVDENVVTFTAEKKLYLLGDYEVTIDETIADLAGNTLGEGESVGFRVRDGRWGAPVYPFGETVPRVVTHVANNEQGDVIVGMETPPDYANIYAGVFRVANGTWTSAAELTAPVGAFLPTFPVAIGAQATIATWGISNVGYGWSRSVDQEAWVDGGALGGFANAAITSGDVAVAAWSSPSSDAVLVRLMDVVDGSLEPESGPPLSNVRNGPFPVTSLDRIGVLATRLGSAETELVVTWKQGSTWTTPEVLGSDPNMGRFNFDSDEQGNIAIVWSESDQIWSRIYNRAEDAWSRELFIETAGPDPLVGDVDMAAGNVVVAFNAFDPSPGTWAAVYESGVGWTDESVATLEEDLSGFAVGVSIDRMGQAIAVWNGDLRSRRYVAGEGWQEPLRALGTNINQYYIWTASAADGSVVVVSNEIVGDENHAPWAIRFE